MIGKIENNRLRLLALTFLFLLLVFAAVPALAGTGSGDPIGALGQAGTVRGRVPNELGNVLAGFIGLAGVGFALGSLGLVVNQIFRRRTVLAYTVMTRKPGWSLLTGVIITLLGLGLVALFEGVEFLQGVIILLYLLGLGLFASGAVIRFGAGIVEPQLIGDDLPSTWAHIKAGIILMAMNVILIVGNVLFVGIFLSGVGATLLSYFAGMGTAVAGLTESDQAPSQPPPSE
jgi:hypothetical protein